MAVGWRSAVFWEPTLRLGAEWTGESGEPTHTTTIDDPSRGRVGREAWCSEPSFAYMRATVRGWSMPNPWKSPL